MTLAELAPKLLLGVISAILFSLGMRGLIWLGRRPPKQNGSWLVLYPAWPLKLLSVFCIAGGIFFLVGTIDAARYLILDPFGSEGWQLHLVMLVVGPPVSIMLLLGALHAICTRIAFDDTLIKFRHHFQSTVVDWNEIAMVKAHTFFGPQIYTIRNKRFPVWGGYCGFDHFIKTARAKGIPVKL